MDELTQERYGPDIPTAELRARPSKLPSRPSEVRARRIALCGTANLGAQGDDEARNRRLLDVIRGWRA